ncbi:MAG: glycoside hydrolase family 3 N-terminal domain-containing protein, partial [bacterium]
SHAVLGASPDLNIEELARWMGEDTHAAGIDMILGPVLDVDCPPFNPVIGGKERSFGCDPVAVGVDGTLFANGLWDAGIVPVFKHFPGHGTATADSHLVLPMVDASRDAWLTSERLAYSTAFDNLRILKQWPWPSMHHPPIGVMVAHLDWPALTNGEGPTCFSRTLVTTELREGFGLQNDVIVSDDLLMHAITDPVAGAIAMRNAGIDLLIVSRDPPVLRAIHAALVEGYRNGDLDRDELRASLERILRLKRYIRDHWVDVNEDSRLLPMELPEGIL